MAVLLQRHGPANVLNAHRTRVFQCLTTLYESIERSGVQLSPSDLLEMKTVVETCLIHYKALSVNAIQTRVLAWPLRPKFHSRKHCEGFFRKIP